MVWMIPIIASRSRRRRYYRHRGSGVIGVIILLVVGILFSVFFFDKFDSNFSAFPVIFVVVGIGFAIIMIAFLSAAIRSNSERNRNYYDQTQQQQRVSNPYTQNPEIYRQQRIPTRQEYDPSRLNKQSAVYCSYCGESTTLDAAFCPKCGNRLNK